MIHTFPLANDYENPFKHPAIKEASILDLIKDLIHPQKRPFDCIQVEVTSFCSAKCIYCPHTTKKEQWNSRHMNAHTFVNLWPLLQKCNRVHLQGWGEPLLHPNFFDFVSLARKAGCAISTTSCGLHLNEENIKKILKSGMDILAFSLAGTDRESNDNARKGADFEKLCQNIKLLQSLRKEYMAVHVEIHLAYIMLADRIEAIEKLPALMKELEVHSTVVSTLDYLADSSQAHLAINPQDTEIIEKARTILKKAQEEAEMNGQKIYYALPSAVPSAECRENIQKSLYVDADGTIAPCIYLNVPDNEAFKLTFGNVDRENILDIWQNKEFSDFREGHVNNIVIDQCRFCVKKFENLY